MRWFRRGHLIAVVTVIITLLLLELIHETIYPSDHGRTIQGLYQKDASEFLAMKSSSTLKPPKGQNACGRNNTEVLLIVPSAVHNLDARVAVRKSWLPHLPSNWLLLFFLGNTKDVIIQGKVNTETEQFEDIIQDLRFQDSYYNLTLKSLALLQWTKKFCPTAKYLLKVDDDIYLNIPKLQQLTACITLARNNMYTDIKNTQSRSNHKGADGNNIPTICDKVNPHNLIHYFINSNTQEYESYFFGGYLYKGVQPDRNKKSKWYLDPKLYSDVVLPPFLSGTAYILSTNLINHILYASKYEPVIHLEDLYISGLVGSCGLKLKLSHLEGWSRFRPRWNSLCLFKNLLTAHGFSPLELTTVTSHVHDLNEEQCDTTTVRISNFLNTFISHLFPRITK